VLDSLKKEITSISSTVKIDCIQGDLTSEEDVNSLWNSSVEKFGTIDVVISCAASRSQMKKIGDTDVQGWWSDFVCQLLLNFFRHGNRLTVGSGIDHRKPMSRRFTY
jgi:NAD(P)-dependent dehydrogenase (short-subunit alcohol dehydrogenase family)